jgi:hypothetical protein
METALLKGLVEQQRDGKRADTGFKKEAWTAVLPAIQAKVETRDPNGVPLVLSQQQATNKLSEFKQLFVI